MLVLTQREGEILQVGDNVRIYIKRIRGGSVRLCIDAPDDVELQRISVPDSASAGSSSIAGKERSSVANDVEVVRFARRR